MDATLRLILRFSFKYGAQGIWVDDLISLSLKNARRLFNKICDEEIVKLECELRRKQLLKQFDLSYSKFVKT